MDSITYLQFDFSNNFLKRLLLVFLNLRRMHKYRNLLNNSLFISLHFIIKRYFHGKGELIKLGELPSINAIGFFCWGRSLTVHIEIKRALFLYFQLSTD
jgi:hypothetical protein